MKVFFKQLCERVVELDLTQEQVDALTNGDGDDPIWDKVHDELNELEFEPATDGLTFGFEGERT